MSDQVDTEWEIRDPVVADATSMGRVHVRAWQAAYRSVMPAAYLDGLRSEDRAAMWRRQIESRAGAGLRVVASAGGVVGFAAFGPCGDADADGGAGAAADDRRVGELYAMNLDPDVWGRGLGRLLLRDVTAVLVGLGFEELVLWVVPENDRARSLYESEGWVPDGSTREEEILGVEVTDMRYRRSTRAR